MKNDLTVIFLTVNKVPEKWAEYHKRILLEAVGDYDLITVSRKPVEGMGLNLLQRESISASNIYFQMLRAAKIAKTKYVAVAEDDALYPAQHFSCFRPKDNEVAYNMCRWGIMTWREPMYFWSNRISNLTLIAPRKYLIKALEERFEKYPEGTPPHKTGEVGKERYETALGLTSNKVVQFWSTIPVINFNHIYAIDPYEQRKRKKPAPLRSYNIYFWGEARQLVKNFK